MASRAPSGTNTQPWKVHVLTGASRQGLVDKIAAIPTHIVHGRFDQVCPLTQATQLVAALEAVGTPVVSFVKTLAGHSAMEGQTVLALTAIMDGLPPLR